MKTLLRWLGAFIFCSFAIFSAPASAGEAFDTGRLAYEQGDFAGSVKSYQGEAGRHVSPGLLHNLGNAHFKLGQLGPAILAWEQARSLDPWLRNATANLHFARNQAGLDEPAYSWAEKYSALLAPDTWTWIVVLGFWSAVGLLTLPSLLRRKRSSITQGGAVVAIGAVLLTLPALLGIATRSECGIIQTTETVLRLTPTQEGEMLAKLAEGDLARSEQAHGDYLYVRASGDRAGWVRRAEFAKIWP